MKLLILGGKGMAGHMLASYFHAYSTFDVYTTSRGHSESDHQLYLDVTRTTDVEAVIDKVQPDIVINCVGILNEHASSNTKLAFQVNSLLPQALAGIMEKRGGRLIHISTDCVFLGDKGGYTEEDITDGTSIYAQSKQLGEVSSPPHLTVRTSIIGPELKQDGIGLFLWFMEQTGTIKGFSNVYWNGVTTLELAKAIHQMIQEDIQGLYHLGMPQAVSKYELLSLIKEVFHKDDISIISDDVEKLDRTVQTVRKDFSYLFPTYKEMLIELKAEMERMKERE
ncbi:SDR family oxidoreductase [Cytobacillus sp. OWB-43]|uniref:dTDP-4-dehydrorhamnose reductase family protein n=1 Tax=Cytobacillus sp. OWB-43 TaxID=3108468 RepID=UPI002AFE8201|nr:SDR family oxidoreductase [Cytobacillus sp. OWB-43]MEA1852157.1 SDR family oxidoreductase [Cytobacillus sp. OWB-43]